MTYGGGVIMIGSEFTSWAKSPASVGGSNTQRVHVRLHKDIDGHCAHARGAGAKIVGEPTDQGARRSHADVRDRAGVDRAPGVGHDSAAACRAARVSGSRDAAEGRGLVAGVVVCAEGAAGIILAALPACAIKAYDHACGSPGRSARRRGKEQRREGITNMPLMPLSKRMLAEFIGTFWLVLGGCGSAVLSAAFPSLGIGFLGVALAFGLTVVTMAYAIGHISGCHLNPAITFGLFVGGRHPGGEILPYWLAQVLGGIAAAGVLVFIASGNGSDPIAAGLAANGFADHSPGHYSLAAGFVCEIVMTAIFLFVIMGSTDKRTPGNFAPLAIGFTLTLIHLISIPVTNTSVNPARSTGPAVFVGGWALAQLWMFWVAPLIGGAVGALAYRLTRGPDEGPGVKEISGT